MIVLGIETSCDETGVAIYDTDNGLLADVLYSQIDLHAQYGGVVPELASRDHVQRIIPLFEQALSQANLKKSQLDGIAYTEGPGLMGALLVGAAAGRSLAWSLGIPGIGVHHMEGHLLAPLLDNKELVDSKDLADEKPEFPFLGLLVSGGHSLLVDVKAHGKYQVIGESLDDAIGEAFDKTAKLLSLGYPGGPAISKIALSGDSSQYKFPRPMTNRPGLDMSFSGLKTFVLNTWEESDKSEQTKANIAAAFQDAIIDTLIIKCKRALKQTGYSEIVIAGGVSANQQLREKMHEYADKESLKVFFPDPKLCTDNGSMIAYAGALRLLATEKVAGDKGSNSFQTRARWSLEDISLES